MAKARRRELFDEAPITEAAKRTGRTPAQVVLRWHVQQGLIPIPKTANLGRLNENIAVFDFELTDTDIEAITAMDTASTAQWTPTAMVPGRTSSQLFRACP